MLAKRHITVPAFNFCRLISRAFEDRNFWKPVGNLLKSNFDCNIEILDLGFFSNSNEFYFSNNSKNIFITHSYGLIWFLERNFKTDLLINFFSTPDFLSFQSEADKKKKFYY